MHVLYLMAVWIHILTIAVWVGAMFFADPHSSRRSSQLVEQMHGVGWYAQAIVWTTGLFMLQYRGITPGVLVSPDFVSSAWGRAMWAKIGLVLVLATFQAIVGHKGGLLYGYLSVTFVVVVISVWLVRPFLL